MTVRALAMTIAAVLTSVAAAAPPRPTASVGTQPQWQPPDPANLQVLPKDISKRELVQTMRMFTRALGVRCEFCHLGEGNDLSKFDFASDEKRQKRSTRVMLRMVTEINTNHLSGIPEPRPAGTPAVTCYTCHRGQTRPLIAAPAADKEVPGFGPQFWQEQRRRPGP
jgi:photosynthetic reaction center cytochrome c subunit